jgi:hypothetical protein
MDRKFLEDSNIYMIKRINYIKGFGIFKDYKRYGISICPDLTITAQEIKTILHWLYAYKLVNLCFSNHEVLNNVYFSDTNLNRLIE